MKAKMNRPAAESSTSLGSFAQPAGMQARDNRSVDSILASIDEATKRPPSPEMASAVAEIGAIARQRRETAMV